MKPEEIQFGPFKTEHHRQTVDERFKACVLDFIAKNIEPRLTVKPVKVEARLVAVYDDPKFFGPNSLVKYMYMLECLFTSEKGTEKGVASLEYDIETGTFSPRSSSRVDTLALQRSREERQKTTWAIMEKVESGAKKIVCPYCGATLGVHRLNGKLKDIKCPTQDCICMHF